MDSLRGIELIGSLDSRCRPAILGRMKSDATSDTLVPSGLLPEIQAAAREEDRTPAELVGEAIERYLRERRWFRKDEVHSKIAQGSNRCGKARVSTARRSWPS
jgi:hypothetical protein